MPRTSTRNGPQTRARIAEVAAGLFHDRGFDDVTVAEVARAAGVSSVTVFNHFPRKEDLFLDRSVDAEELVRTTVRDRPAEVDVLDALHGAATHLAETEHPLSGLDPRSLAFFETIAHSPALVARAREIGAELGGVLATELRRDASTAGDADLLAALVVAGYGTVLVATARRLVDGDRLESRADDHRAALDRLFAVLRSGVQRQD